MEYVYSSDRPVLSAPSNESGILPGEFVITVSGGGCRRATGTDSRIAGLVEDFDDEHIAENPYDYRSSQDDFTYDTGMRVKFGGDEQGALLRARTPADNGSDPAANIVEWNVVGIPDIAGFEGRIVEEGYTDGGSTVYERGAGNFLPIGVARGNSSEVPVNGFNELTHIVRKINL